MTTAKTISTEARSLRAAIGRSGKTFVAAHRQIALRRISSVLLLADKNLPHAQTLMAEARYHAQFVLQA
jgi:hypothetical protein